MKEIKRQKTLTINIVSKEDEELFILYRQLTDAKALKRSQFAKRLIRDWVNQEMEKNHKVVDLNSIKRPNYSDVVEISREEEDLNKKLDEFQNQF